MSATRLDRLFNPRGVAVIGASANLARPGGQTVRALVQLGYQGGIYPVNPKYEEIAGVRCFPSVTAVGAPIDTAVIALPAAQVPDAIEECGRSGVSYAVVLGGGFHEVGSEGAAIEQAMLAAARAHGIRIVGPNCLGLVNIPARVFTAFGSVTKPPLLQPGGVSAIIQSGGFGNSVVVQCAAAGIGFRYVVASGMEVDVTMPELIDAMIDDIETRVILLYLEGVGNGRALASACERAVISGKPVVVLKSGNTRQGQQAAASHTASMTSGYDLYRAAFAQAGATEVSDIFEAVDCLQCFASGRLPEGRGVATMGGSGGSAVVFSDAADQWGLTLAAPEAKTAAALRDTLPRMASIANPIDYTAGFVTDATGDRFQSAVEAVLADPGIHQLGMLLATAAGPNFLNAVTRLAAASRVSPKPIMLFSSMSSEFVGEQFAVLRAAGIPIIPSPRRVARAMAALCDYVEARARLAAERDAAVQIAMPRLPKREGALDEYEGKRLLGEFGIAVTRDVLLPPRELSRADIDGLALPVAVKVASRDIAHKTDIDAVRLGINDADAVVRAARDVLANAARAQPAAEISGILISEMLEPGLETIVGVVNDASFGPVVALGLGGIFAEALKDVTYRLAPFDLRTAHEMIGELRGAALFGEIRGRPARDTEALAQLLTRVSQLAWIMRDRLAELDINPVIVGAQGKGAIAADALVVLR